MVSERATARPPVTATPTRAPSDADRPSRRGELLVGSAAGRRRMRTAKAMRKPRITRSSPMRQSRTIRALVEMPAAFMTLVWEIGFLPAMFFPRLRMAFAVE